MKILILGGTGEARQLAAELVALGHDVTTSLAGRTAEPLLPAGAVRSGGFGGAQGLADFIASNGIERLVDATHPYAVKIAANAVESAALADVPLVRLMRPPWAEPAGASWRNVQNAEEAAAVLPAGARVLLTVGHTGLDAFLARNDCAFIVRSIEPPEALPSHARSLIARPPFTPHGETALMADEAITHLVTKNAGGTQTEAKLQAAQELRVVVVMIARPVLPAAVEVGSVEEAIAALGLRRQ